MQQPYFDAKTLQRVKDFPVVIKALAQGFLHGIHTSQQRGVGVEFSQFRAYEPGDELSKIDWKLFARSDKYFVREAERESDVNVWFVLDCSGSMLQQSSANNRQSEASLPDDSTQLGRWNKLDYARYLIATLSYLAQKQGDAVGLLTLSGEQTFQLPALPGNKHWQKLLLALTKLKADGRIEQNKQVLKYLNAVQENALVVVVSDFHQQNLEVSTLLSQLKNSKTDVIAYHLDCDDEINFSYQGLVKFQDLETKQSITVDAKDIKDDYLETKRQINQQLITQCYKQDISYFTANIDQALDQSLLEFLQARARGNRR